jgi:hypothetical protein
MDRVPQTPSWPPDIQQRRAGPRFNVISALSPLLGFVNGCVVAYVLNDHYHWWAGHAIEAGIHTLGWFVVVGFLAGVIAWVRVEKWRGVTALGLLLNGAALVLFWANSYSVWPGVWPEP